MRPPQFETQMTQAPRLLTQDLTTLAYSTLALFGLLASPSHALTLAEYLSQVEQSNGSYRSAIETTAGAMLRASESNLVTAPTLFGNATLVNDSKFPQSAASPYELVWVQNYSVGVSKQWSFGLNTKASFNFQGTSYINPTLISFGSVLIGAVNQFNAFPLFEVSLPLISQGFGVGVRASETLAEAGALAASYGARFQSKTLTAQAESTYWRLSVARRLYALSKETLSRTEKIAQWNQRRAQMQLADRADALQSAAGLQQARLSVQSAEDELRNASRAFNSTRNVASETVDESLEDFDTALVETLEIPKRADKRDDVLSAEQSFRVTEANATLSMQKNLPQFDVFASLALNGQPAGLALNYPQSFSESLRYSFTFNHPTATVGLRLNMPLAPFSMADGIQGWIKEKSAAELTLARKLFDQEQTWTELNQTFAAAKKKLGITKTLEKIQREKLNHERVRYERGRTTTFQLLSFENDFLTAQLNRIRTEFEVISTLAQLKLFAEGRNANPEVGPSQQAFQIHTQPFASRIEQESSR